MFSKMSVLCAVILELRLLNQIQVWPSALKQRMCESDLCVITFVDVIDIHCQGMERWRVVAVGQSAMLYELIEETTNIIQKVGKEYYTAIQGCDRQHDILTLE